MWENPVMLLGEISGMQLTRVKGFPHLLLARAKPKHSALKFI